MAHQKYSREEMSAMVERFEQSDRSRKAFCAAEGINVHTFQYWRDKLTKDKDKTSPRFRQVKTNSSINPTGGIRLRYQNQVQLELPADYSVERLSELIRRLSC